MLAGNAEKSGTRAEWLAARRKGIGASDAAAILGLSPFATPLSVWAEKKEEGPVPEEEGSEWLEWGLRLEAPISKKFTEVTGQAVRPLGTTILRDEELPYLSCTLDYATTVPNTGPTRDMIEVPLEIKTSGGWNEGDWQDEPPIHVQVQVQMQMMVTKSPLAFVAVLLGGRKFRYYKIARNDAFIATMRRKLVAFWESVQANEPPRAGASDAETLSKLYPREKEEQSIELDGECARLDEEREKLKGQIKEFETEVDRITNLLKQKIGENSQGILPNGVILRWQTQHRDEHTVKASDFRVLRRLKAKAVKA